MTTGRKLLVWIGVPIVLVVLALIVAPMVLSGPIEARAKAEIERRVDARVDWRDAGLTFFRNFPNVTLTLEDITVLGIDRFEGDTLAAVPAFRLVFDLGSVLFGEQTIVRSVSLVSPAVNLIVLEDGSANWDILRETSTVAAGEPDGRGLNIGLRSLDIDDGRVVFDNRQAGLSASLSGLDHSLSGDFTRERFGIETRTHAAGVTVRSAGIAYLNAVEMDAVADIDADMVARRFTFGDNEVRLNDLVLTFTGAVAAVDDAIELDIAFDSPANDFRSLLSLVPAVYARDFESIETEGQLSVAGRIGGRYGENTFPALAISARVDDASFRYPDLPLPARDISVDLAIDNPGGNADSTVVRVRRLNARIGEDAIAAAFTLRTPVSDPELDLSVGGTLDLDAARRTFKLENVEELAGVITADVAVRARKSAVVARQYERIDASGDIVASGVAVRTADLPHRITIDELALGLSPRTAELRSLRGTIGGSDMRIRGTIENLIGFAMGEGDLRGTVTMESDRIDLTEWQSEEDSLRAIPVPPRLDFGLRTTIAELHHGRLDMTDARGFVRIRDRRLTMDSLRLAAVGGEFRLAGYYDTTEPDRPTFDVDVRIVDAELGQSFEALTTVRLLAPVARYAEGRYSTSLQLTGALGGDMTPILTALTGRGALETSQLVLRNFPPMNRLAEALSSQRLENPAFRAIRTAIDIRDGRLHVRPFDVSVGATTLTVGGSNGLDRSLDYDLVLALPPSALESDARQTVSQLFTRAGVTGIALDTMSVVRVGVRLTGTIDDPSVSLDVGRGVQTAVQSLEQAAQESVQRAVEAAEARADSAAAAARRRVEAQAQLLIDQAEQRAATIRAEARELAATIRAQANQRADSLVARATSPVARIAAERAAERLRQEADQQANRITAEADSRADALIAAATLRADSLRSGDLPADTVPRDTMAVPLVPGAAREPPGRRPA